jgi:hypothetical protein
MRCSATHFTLMASVVTRSEDRSDLTATVAMIAL